MTEADVARVLRVICDAWPGVAQQSPEPVAAALAAELARIPLSAEAAEAALAALKLNTPAGRWLGHREIVAAVRAAVSRPEAQADAPTPREPTPWARAGFRGYWHWFAVDEQAARAACPELAALHDGETGRVFRERVAKLRAGGRVTAADVLHKPEGDGGRVEKRLAFLRGMKAAVEGEGATAC